MKKEYQSKQMVLFPFMAQGHNIPFLALARVLERRRPQVSGVTIVSTPVNVAKIAASLPPDSSVALAELPFSCADHGLPPGTENTDSLTSQTYVLPFFRATESAAVKSSFYELVSRICKREEDTAVCIVSDFLLGWTVEVAERLGVFHAVFFPGAAYPFGMFSSLWFNLPHCKAAASRAAAGEADHITLPDFPEAPPYQYSRLPKYLTPCDETNPWAKWIQSQLSMCFRSHGVLFNTVKELEGIGLTYFSRKMMNRPVWTIGPIVTSINRCSTHPCLEWLSLHPPSSVLYVCFGSQYTISTGQMKELAKGLEASDKPFIWVVRPPLELDPAPATGDFALDDCLPEGFESHKGLLVRNWAPQVEILAHESTGAFLSHCGWNSVVESLTQGVPIIAWPLSAEQYYTSKMLEEELRVSVEIAHGDTMEIDGGRVSRSIDLVMGSSEMRKRALSIKDTMSDALKEEGDSMGSSVRALNDFLGASVTKTGTTRTTTRHHADLSP